MSQGAQQPDPWGQVSTLVAGPVAWGAIGYGVDALADSHVFLPAGLVLGILASAWLVIARYTAAERLRSGDQHGPTTSTTGGDRR